MGLNTHAQGYRIKENVNMNDWCWPSYLHTGHSTLAFNCDAVYLKVSKGHYKPGLFLSPAEIGFKERAEGQYSAKTVLTFYFWQVLVATFPVVVKCFLKKQNGACCSGWNNWLRVKYSCFNKWTVPPSKKVLLVGKLMYYGFFKSHGKSAFFFSLMYWISQDMQFTAQCIKRTFWWVSWGSLHFGWPCCAAAHTTYFKRRL